MSSRSRGTPNGGMQSPAAPERGGVANECKRSCCWTPGFGHSTARDTVPKWHKEACHCHDKREDQR